VALTGCSQDTSDLTSTHVAQALQRVVEFLFTNVFSLVLTPLSTRPNAAKKVEIANAIQKLQIAASLVQELIRLCGMFVDTSLTEHTKLTTIGSEQKQTGRSAQASLIAGGKLSEKDALEIIRENIIKANILQHALGLMPLLITNDKTDANCTPLVKSLKSLLRVCQAKAKQTEGNINACQAFLYTEDSEGIEFVFGPKKDPVKQASETKCMKKT